MKKKITIFIYLVISLHGAFAQTQTTDIFISAPDESEKSAIVIRQSNSNDYGFDFGLDQNQTGDLFFYTVFGNAKTALMQFSRTNKNVGIGFRPVPGYTLAVAGKIVTEEINVKLSGTWPDYVFEPGHKLLSLSELEKFIIKNKHLPGVPASKEVEQNGVSLGEMNTILLKKIEEMTLYLIDLQKTCEKIKQENMDIKEYTEDLKKNFDAIQKENEKNKNAVQN